MDWSGVVKVITFRVSRLKGFFIVSFTTIYSYGYIHSLTTYNYCSITSISHHHSDEWALFLSPENLGEIVVALPTISNCLPSQAY